MMCFKIYNEILLLEFIGDFVVSKRLAKVECITSLDCHYNIILKSSSGKKRRQICSKKNKSRIILTALV